MIDAQKVKNEGVKMCIKFRVVLVYCAMGDYEYWTLYSFLKGDGMIELLKKCNENYENICEALRYSYRYIISISIVTGSFYNM